MNYPIPPTTVDAPVLCWRDGAIAHIRFNRPQVLNAIDVATAKTFHTACLLIADDPLVRAVVVSGEGRAFMAGGDLVAMREAPVEVAAELIAGMHGGIAVLAGLQAPVIAALHGAVAGGGLGLALGCDLAIAAEGTRFSIAYPLIGASSDCATSWNLPRLVGLRKALQIALLAESFDAVVALNLGIVNKVVPAHALRAETDRMARKLAEGPTLALGHLKRLMRQSYQNDLSTQLDAEAQNFLASVTTQDFANGVSAFLEKRKPSFMGH